MWSDGVLPTTGENVVIDQPGTYTVTLTTNVEIDNLFWGGCNVGDQPPCHVYGA